MRKPAWIIQLDNGNAFGGRSIPMNVTRRVIQIRITDERGLESDTLEVDLDDRDGILPLPETGKWLNIWIGWQGIGLWYKGRYLIDEVEHSGPPDILTVRGRAAALRDTLKQGRTQSYDNITLAELTNQIATRNNLIPATASNLADIHFDHLDQRDESDVHFLSRITQEQDIMATVKQGRLLIMRNSQGTTASGAAMPRAIIKRGDGDRYRYQRQDRSGTTTGVVATWHDKQTAEDKTVLAGEDSNTKALRRVYATEAEAKRAAGGEHRRIIRAANNLNITLAYGRVDLSTETPVILSEFKPGIDGSNWVIKHLEHSLNASGFLTTIDLEPLTQ